MTEMEMMYDKYVIIMFHAGSDIDDTNSTVRQ